MIPKKMNSLKAVPFNRLLIWSNEKSCQIIASNPVCGRGILFVYFRDLSITASWLSLTTSRFLLELALELGCLIFFAVCEVAVVPDFNMFCSTTVGDSGSFCFVLDSFVTLKRRLFCER